MAWAGKLNIGENLSESKPKKKLAKWPNMSEPVKKSLIRTTISMTIYWAYVEFCLLFKF